MSKAKRSWTVGLNGHNANTIYDEEGKAVCQVYAVPLHTSVADVPTRYADGLKLAYEIAAAPTLLAACEHILAILDHPKQSVSVFDADKLRAAIAKAKGEA
jgi:hypothetical protein